MAQLTFGAETAALLERAYAGADFSRRRRMSFDALDPRPGDRIADIGAGNGYLTTELARAVGDTGQVIAVEPSADMRRAAEARIEGETNVRLLGDTAQALSLPDDSLDKAVSVQVFEYFDDLTGPVEELARVLKPGGRAVLSDMHFGTFVWFSHDPERMARMMRSWDSHCAETRAPEKFPSVLTAAGFRNILANPVSFCDTFIRPDGLARMMMILMRHHAIANGHVQEDVAHAWYAEQEALSEQGEFFFNITHFVTTAELG